MSPCQSNTAAGQPPGEVIKSRNDEEVAQSPRPSQISAVTPADGIQNPDTDNLSQKLAQQELAHQDGMKQGPIQSQKAFTPLESKQQSSAVGAQ